ncbi:interaptin-like isoform X4 [Clytia hemisphaerica]|uniref:interaptin-like isoform X4 n=1 Tax=Clytia hemisphaerica TaxID=252671 RepID=UPI0034D479EA
MRGPNQQKRLGAVDINIPNILVHEDGIFKALLTTTCKQQPLPCQPDGEIFTEPSEGKVLTDKWQLSGERNQIFHNDQNGTFKIELTKQLVGQPILLHATLLRYDEAKVVPQVSDGFVVHSQGTVQIYPRKKLFDSDKTIVGAKHSIKLKLSSNLENEMVRVASGWLELFVDVSIFQEAKEQAPKRNVKQKGDLIEEEEEENEPPYPLMRDESPVMPPPTNKLDNDVTRIDSPATGMVKEESHFNLPGLNAVRELLPKYHSLSTNEEEQRNRKARKYSVEPHVPIKEPPSKDSGDEFDQQFRDTRQQTYLNPNLDVMITYQWKEIERLKDCCNKMADDIRQQRQEILKLGHEKSQLSHQLAVARTEGINEDTNSVVGQLRSQLIMESKEKIELQERVNNLQNEIIQKNEVEEKYLQLQTAHEEQQKTLHDLQIKNAEVNRMKLNIQKQEKIIQLLEQENGQMARTGKPNKQSEKNSNSSKSRDQEKSVAMVTENIQQIDDQLKMVRELEEAHHTIAMLKDHLERVEREQHYSNVKSFYERKSLPYGYGNQRPSIMAANSMGRFHQSPYTQHNWRNEQRDSNSLQRYSYNFGKRIGGGGGKYQH